MSSYVIAYRGCSRCPRLVQQELFERCLPAGFLNGVAGSGIKHVINELGDVRNAPCTPPPPPLSPAPHSVNALCLRTIRRCVTVLRVFALTVQTARAVAANFCGVAALSPTHARACAPQHALKHCLHDHARDKFMPPLKILRPCLFTSRPWAWARPRRV